jgi:hypothetical protein
MVFEEVFMKKSKILMIIFLIFWMLVIFLFSNQNATKSQNLSDNVTSKIIDVAYKITKNEKFVNNRKRIIKRVRFVIRKTAHFTLYFILGVIVYLLLNKLGVSHKIIFTILICFAYACSDEFHQMFVDERTAKILDVFIDTIGSTCGIILSNIILNVLKKCKCDISNQCNA